MSKNMKIKPPKTVIKNNSRISFHGFVADKGGCGHIRIILPFLYANIERWKNKNIQINPSWGMKYITDPSYYKDTLYVIFQRAATEEQLQVVKYLKQNVFCHTGTKIIYEIDDDLIDVPEWNMASDYFNKHRKYCLNIIENSWGVTTSTEHLAKKLRKYNKSVNVNPNHLCKYMWGDIPDIKEIEGKPKVLWCGSSNHFALPGSKYSGGDFGDELIEFIRKTTDKYDWIFIGAIPRELLDIKDKIHHHNWQSIFNYPYYIKSLDVDIGLAPLFKHDFNRSKSNIKALEYTAAGIPGIYSNMVPYENLKNTCDTDEEIISNIEKLASDIDKRKETWNHDYELLKDQLFWEDNNNVKKYLNNYLDFFNMKLPEDE